MTAFLIFLLVSASFEQGRIAIDQWLNLFIWSKAEGFGKADEVLSARAWRLGSRYPTTWGRFERLVNLAFFWQKDSDGLRNHCYRSYVAERDRRHYPKEYRSA